MKDKKTRDLVTIAIREPEDLLLMDEAPGSSIKDEAQASNSQVPTRQDLHDSDLLDLNMNCQVNTGPEASTQIDYASFEFGEKCQSKCEECK